MAEVALSFDLGSSALRGGALDEDGETRAEAEMLFARQAAGAAEEVDPGLWWRAFAAVTATLLDQVARRGDRAVGLAITGITRTQVFLDTAGQPVRPAITWADSRARRQAEALAVLREDRADLPFWPQVGSLDGFHPLARILWLRDEEPVAFASLARVVEPKDYLAARLTGTPACDAISMARLLGQATGAARQRLFAACGLPGDLLPPPQAPGREIGRIQAGLPAPFDRLAGLPVFLASLDTWCAVLGLGALRPGLAYAISGTTEVFGVMATQAQDAEGLLTLRWLDEAGCPALYQIGGPSQVGIGSLLAVAAWLGLGESKPAALLARLEALPRAVSTPLFLPYLDGERVPHWNPDLRGALFGLSAEQRPDDLLRSLVEGVALGNRLALQRAIASGVEPPRALHIGGGAAGSDLWCQTKADILQLPVLRGAAREAGLLGAAMLVFTGLGRHASLAEAQTALAKPAATFKPDPARAETFDALYALFEKLQAANSEASAGLARLAAENRSEH